MNVPEPHSPHDLQERDQLVDHLRRSTLACVVRELNTNPDLSAPILEHQINNILATAYGYVSIEQLESISGETKFFVSVLQTAGPDGNLYIVAFDPHLPYGNNVIWGLAPAFGGYRAVATTDSAMKGYALHLLPLEHHLNKGIRFLAFGNRIGASYYPVRAIVYSFDGKSIDQVWSRDDLRQGTVSAHGDRMILSYQDIVRMEMKSPPYFVREEYKLAPHGVMLLSKRRTEGP